MRVKFKRGTAADHETYVGPAGTLSIVTDTNQVRVHDGVTAGGHPAVGFPEMPPDDGGYYLLRNGQWVPVAVEEIAAEGPGPTIIDTGDSSLGYFGTLQATELYTGDQLAQAVGLSAGTLVNSDTGWLKFALNDKILFIPQKPIRHNLSWEDIYQAGCVYGLDGDGANPSGTPVNQNKTVRLNGYTYRVRLMRGADIDPSGAVLDSNNPSGTYQSEWNQLIEKVHITNGTWGTLTDADLSVGSGETINETLCQESINGSPGSRVVRGKTEYRHFDDVSVTVSQTSNGWRPVLELVQ